MAIDDRPESKIARMIDEMLAAQSRFARAWRDGQPLTEQQKQDEEIRDGLRAELIARFEAKGD